MVTRLKQIAAVFLAVLLCGGYFLDVSLILFGHPFDYAEWALRFLIRCSPLAVVMVGTALTDAARDKKFSISPARGGYCTSTPAGVAFTAFEDLSSLELEDTLKPVGRQMVARARGGQEISRDPIRTSAQVLAACAPGSSSWRATISRACSAMLVARGPRGSRGGKSAGQTGGRVFSPNTGQSASPTTPLRIHSSICSGPKPAFRSTSRVCSPSRGAADPALPGVRSSLGDGAGCGTPPGPGTSTPLSRT